MIDVMQHKLVSERKVWRGYSESTKVDLLRVAAAQMGAEAGRLIAERWPPATSTSDDHELLTMTVYVFSPQELAQLLSDVRDKAIEETLAVAESLIPEQEKPDEQ